MPPPALTPNMQSLVKTLRHDLDGFLEAHLPRRPSHRCSSKVVHDGLWGTVRLTPIEVAFIDTPLLQRLRQTRQTGLALFTYPSTTHTRFEHTLGVVLQTERLGRSLLEHTLEKQFTEVDLQHMRLAALFHDIGHGPFSHTSEEIYGVGPLMECLKRKRIYNAAGAHEILAHLILTSDRFRDYCDKLSRMYHVDIPIDEIADCIVGKSSDPRLTFKREILNGPLDADKLDYLFRDSHFSGLPLSVDLDRLSYTVRVHNIKGKRRIVVTHSGATPLEQILFSKMVLFTTVYQHHKVRSCDCMFAGIIEYMREHKASITVGSHTLDWSTPVDFLWASEGAFLAHGFNTTDRQLHRLVHDLFYRRLLKRAMIISRKTIKQSDSDRWDAVLKHATISNEAGVARRRIAEKIWEVGGRPCLKQEVWLDLPKLPSMEAAESTFVLPADEERGKPVPLNSLFPTDQWVKNYGEHKWRGHVLLTSA